MNKAFHKAIYMVGLVTTVVYTVKAVNFAIPIGEKLLMEALSNKFESVVLGEEPYGMVEVSKDQKPEPRMSFTINIPRRRKGQ